MNATAMDLPIQEVIPDCLQALRQSGRLVLAAPPGAGKTTGLPPAILEGMPERGRLILLQPRRMAARAVAGRLAHLLGSPLGERVGYQIRLERHWGAQTQIVVMTYGVLLRRLQTDPFLESFGTVVLDEFHERSLEADLALGMLHRVRSAMRPDLQLVVMSATLDAEPVAQFLDDAPLIASPGRMYPVEMRYAKSIDRQRLEDQVAEALPSLLKQSPGHVLVFLPGIGEIRRVERRIQEIGSKHQCELLALYGDLPADQQDYVLSETGKRKIILATNVAETSITIPGVTAVIDSGLARVLRMHPEVGLPRLDLEPISQAAAEQRAGRAGRTGPGICQRLWMQATHRARAEFDIPEVLRGDMASAVLQLAGWGETEPDKFPWLTPPTNDAIASGQRLLEMLGALTDNRITPLGRLMLKIPAHPRLARLLVASLELGISAAGCVAAALLAERDPFIDGVPGKASADDLRLYGLDTANFLDRVERMQKWLDGADDPAITRVGGETVRRAVEQFAQALNAVAREQGTDEAQLDRQLQQHAAETSAEVRLSEALLVAFPDRVARQRHAGSDRGIMVGETGVRLKAPLSVRGSEFYLCLELMQKGRDADVSWAAPINLERLPSCWAQGLREADECFFHPSQRRIVGRHRRYWYDLILAETPTEVIDRTAASEILWKEIRGHWDRVFPSEDTEIAHLIARLALVQATLSELNGPVLNEEAWQEIGRNICLNSLSLDQVRSGPWLEYAQSRIGYDWIEKLERLAPRKILLPSGKEGTIEYRQGNPPSLAVRLQEVFGWQETPRILNGRQPLLLRLLAPNYREVQVTQDLASFWRTGYFEVRKELKRRYGKHHWPDDPLAAQATRSGLGRDAQ